MAARIHKIRHDEETRARIQTNKIIERLQAHVLDNAKMDPTQVRAALGLIAKTLPDLSASEITTTVRHDATDYTRDDLVRILEQAYATNGSGGTLAPNGRDDEPNSVH